MTGSAQIQNEHAERLRLRQQLNELADWHRQRMIDAQKKAKRSTNPHLAELDAEFHGNAHRLLRSLSI
jgi:hypothetical protein